MKTSLTTITNSQNTSAINDNFAKIQDALNNGVLWRENPVGEANQMGNLLDMNGGSIVNGGDAHFSTVVVNGTDLSQQVQNAKTSADQAAVSATQSAQSATQAALSASQAAIVVQGLPVSAKTYGAKGDGVTDDSDALQQWINYLVTNNRKGYLPKGLYKITKTLNFQTLPGWVIEGELSVFSGGAGGGSCIIQHTDNIPIFNLGASAGSYLHSWRIIGITFDYKNNQPSTNTNAIPILFSTMAFEGALKNCYFNRGFYAIKVANGVGCPWGSEFDELIFGNGISGGAMDWSQGVNATPNNHFGRFNVNCNGMIGPVFIVRGYNFTIDNIEFLNANNSPVLFRLIAGSVCIANTMKLEIFNYTQAASLFDIQAGSNFKLGHFNIGGTTGVINVPSGQQVVIFAIGTSSPGTASAIRVGVIIASATSVVNGNAYLIGASPGTTVVVDDINTTSWLLQNNGSTTSAENITVSSFVQGRISQDLGDTNQSASPGITPNTLVFNTPFTSARTVTLPSNGSQLHNGLYFEVIVNGAVNGSNTLTVQSGATTLATISADKMVYRFTWRRNTTGSLGWIITKKESIA